MNALFATFDLFPSPKGAGTHIAQTALALESAYKQVHLMVLGHGDMPGYQEEGRIVLHRCLAAHPNFLRRSEYFGEFLDAAVSRMGEIPGYVHFRDIWSGLPLLEHPRLKQSVKVFEVNGLPSVELPCHYPALSGNVSLLKSLRTMEDYCLSHADGIITVSDTGRRYLSARGVPDDKICVVANMAHLPEEMDLTGESPHPPEGDFLLYAGTASPWQGLPLLLEAFRMIQDDHNVRLLLALSNRKHLKGLRRLIRKARLEERVGIHTGLTREEMYRLYQGALFSAAPLTRCDRNELQGCSPIKILESMACGTPVVASRLPVCGEIITHGKDGLLFTPDSVRSLARAMETLLSDRASLAALGREAARKIQEKHNGVLWTKSFLQTCSSFMIKEERNDEERKRSTRYRRGSKEGEALRPLEV